MGTPALQVRPDAVDFGVVALGEECPWVDRAEQRRPVTSLVLDELRLADADPTIELDWRGG
jgi:hypothetical protein